MRRAENIATTPPNLLGMERRMAYAHRKYHSGLMCGGEVIGSAGMKFSGSLRRFGADRVRRSNKRMARRNPNKSLKV